MNYALHSINDAFIVNYSKIFLYWILMGNNHDKPNHTVEFDKTVTLLGQSEVTSRHLNALIDSTAPLICADGGANTAVEFGLVPEIIVGDMDSFSGPFDGHVIHLSEQDTTDFEKCLYSIKAPLYIGYGFLGGRVDHELTALSVLVRYPERPVILIGDEDICFCCPKRLDIDLPKGTRVSVFPMSQTKMRSSGLKWPLDDIMLSPSMRTGTSNMANGKMVSLTLEQGDAVVILPVKFLDAVKRALTGG
jgi:thiamine pyrophosphokinase